MKYNLLFIALALFVGVFTGRALKADGTAQVISPAYTCQLDAGGATANPCAQYIVQISTQKGLQAVQIWQVPDNPVPISGYVRIGAGNTGAFVQVFNPDQTTTSTINVSRP